MRSVVNSASCRYRYRRALPLRSRPARRSRSFSNLELHPGQPVADIGPTSPRIYTEILAPLRNTSMAPKSMKTHIAEAAGFLAALDQSGGSTPGALRLYGIPESAYSGDAEMFARMHEMRVRVMTAPAFTGDKVIGAILFERTMDGEVQGKPTPFYLWNDRCVPFLKVYKGLGKETDGVSLMKPIPGLDTLLARATACAATAPTGNVAAKHPQRS